MSDIIVIEKALLNSKAFRTLNGQQKTVLLDFLMKRRVKQVRTSGIKVMMILNNGEIQYSYQEALKRGITKPAFARALDTLIERGFIDIARQGTGGRDRETSLYSISERWRKWDRPDFDPGKPRVKDRRQGIGFAQYWKKRRTANLGNDLFTETGKQDVAPKEEFEKVLDVSSKQNVKRKKAKKLPRAASPMGEVDF